VSLGEVYSELILREYTRSGYMITSTNVAYNKITPEFERNSELERRVHIGIDKKAKYIRKKYYSGMITKGKKCITDVLILDDDHLLIRFKTARLFPTLYIDFLVISEYMKEHNIKYASLFFEKIWIGAHIVLIKEYNQTKSWVELAQHWEVRMMCDKFPTFLEKVREKWREI